jgi:hypothetical protein
MPRVRGARPHRQTLTSAAMRIGRASHRDHPQPDRDGPVRIDPPVGETDGPVFVNPGPHLRSRSTTGVSTPRVRRRTTAARRRGRCAKWPAARSGMAPSGHRVPRSASPSRRRDTAATPAAGRRPSRDRGQRALRRDRHHPVRLAVRLRRRGPHRPPEHVLGHVTMHDWQRDRLYDEICRRLAKRPDGPLRGQ